MSAPYLLMYICCILTRHLHPHLSHLNIVLDGIQNLLCIGDSQNLEIHIPEVDRVEGVVLPGDDDGAFVDWGADFEADAIVRGKYPIKDDLYFWFQVGGNLFKLAKVGSS